MLPLHAQSGPEYREFRLGSSLARVLSQVHLTAADVSAVHERPALIQDLRWTTPYFITDSSEPKNDSVGRIVFSFVDDQLFRLAIDYEPKRTEGMTDTDMIVALSARYGSLMTAPGPATTSILDRAADETGRRVAQWHDGGIIVVLLRGAFTKAL